MIYMGEVTDATLERPRSEGVHPLRQGDRAAALLRPRGGLRHGDGRRGDRRRPRVGMGALGPRKDNDEPGWVSLQGWPEQGEAIPATSSSVPQVNPMDEPTVVPELPGALDELSKNQRVAVVMIHGFGYTEREVADLVGISRWSVRTHAERGLNKLRSTLGVTIDV